MALSIVKEVPGIREAPNSENALGDALTSSADSNLSDSQAHINLSSSRLLPRPIIVAMTDDEAEVDTTDLPMKKEPMHEVSNLPLLGDASSVRLRPSGSSGSLRRPGLTLSAFRRPAFRLTRADPCRKLEQWYDLHRLGCSGVLGHGAFSTVRLGARRTDAQPVAVKSIAKHEALRSRRLRDGRHLEEWEILQRLKGHPYMIQMLDVFESDEEIHIVMEYCKGGELFNAIQRKRNRTQAMRRGQYSEQQAACITSQILRALSDLHHEGIVHRDVKLENILLLSDEENSVRVKLCDFGMARSHMLSSPSPEQQRDDSSPLTPGRSRSNSVIGSNYYVAPEICCGSEYNSAADMYSLGVTLYILLCGFPPVFSDGDKVIFPNSYWRDISEDAKELVRKMLHPDPALRISATEALRDAWIWKNRKSIVPAVVRTTTTSTFAASCRWKAPKDRAVNLDLVRTRLNKSLVRPPPRSSGKKRRLEDPTLSPKRQRRRASTALMALADLYRDVAQSPSAKVLSSTFITNMDEAMATASPLPTLSV